MSSAPPISTLTGLLHHTARALARVIEDRTRDRALTTAQWRLLVMLRKHGPSRQARLAEILGIEPISLSRLVDRMARSGWVERHPDPEDRRAQVIHPTRRGSDSLLRLGDVAEAVAEIALTGFSATERQALFSMLDRMNDNLTRDTLGAPSPAPNPRETAE